MNHGRGGEACGSACYECLKNYGNTFHHPSLDRHHAVTLLAEWDGLALQNTIEPSSGETPIQGEPHHAPEQVFLMALQEAGLVGDDGPELNALLELGDGMPHTWPDAINRTKKVAVYLDGLSRTLDGAPRTKETDALITGILRLQGWKVHRIPYSALSDPTMKVSHFKALSQSLAGA